MMTATKALIAFCLLAVVGTVLVIGPTELRRLSPGGAKDEFKTGSAVAAKPDAKPEAKAEAKIEITPESKPEESKVAASTQPAPAASPAPA
ncbi:peptidoglycan-binding protein LysM, partial [Bradyrhizobium sp. AS23.2]